MFCIDQSLAAGSNNFKFNLEIRKEVLISKKIIYTESFKNKNLHKTIKLFFIKITGFINFQCHQ